MKTQPDIDTLNRLFSYDPETGLLTRKVNSGTAKAGDIAGTINGKGYRDVRVKSVLCKVHRIAWCMSYGEYPRGEIDHINGVRSDNRLCNLRDVSASTNMRNKSRYRSNTTGAPGISFTHGKWHAAIKDKPGHQLHLGVFSEYNDAVQARRKAEIEFGYHINHGRSKNG